MAKLPNSELGLYNHIAPFFNRNLAIETSLADICNNNLMTDTYDESKISSRGISDVYGLEGSYSARGTRVATAPFNQGYLRDYFHFRGLNYGYLYDWHTVNNAQNYNQGLGPPGWNVASWGDYNIFDYYTGASVYKHVHKDHGTVDPYWAISVSSSACASDSVHLLPGGYRDANGSFANIRQKAHYWTPGSGAANVGTMATVEILGNGTIEIIEHNSVPRGQGCSIKLTYYDADNVWQPGDTITIDGIVYNTVGIPFFELTMVWTVQNLRTTTYRSGAPITLASTNGEWTAGGTGGKFCAYTSQIPGETDFEFVTTLRHF